MATIRSALRRLFRFALVDKREPHATATPTPRSRARATAETSSYPGDYPGHIAATYSPKPDGEPDPGEIVWAWVPFEENPREGKDRPVLIVGNERFSGRDWLLVLMLTSKDHHTADRRDGAWWIDIGTGAWDRSGRPSEIGLERVIRIDPASIRREGAVLDHATYATVTRELARTRT